MNNIQVCVSKTGGLLAVAAITATVSLSATPAFAGDASNSIQRFGTEFRHAGGNSRTTVDSHLVRQESGSFHGSSHEVRLNVTAPKAGDFKFNIDGSDASVWSQAGQSGFSYFNGRAHERQNYTEGLNQITRTVANSYSQSGHHGHTTGGYGGY